MGASKGTVYDIRFEVGRNISPVCFNCPKKECTGSCSLLTDNQAVMWNSNKGKASERSKRQKERRKAAGLCVYCGNAPPNNGNTMCTACMEKLRKKQQEKRMKKREERMENQHDV